MCGFARWLSVAKPMQSSLISLINIVWYTQLVTCKQSHWSLESNQALCLLGAAFNSNSLNEKLFETSNRALHYVPSGKSSPKCMIVSHKLPLHSGSSQ